MRFIKRIVFPLFIVIILSISSAETRAQFTINDTYASLADCDTMTRGIYIVWWDKNTNYASQVDVLLDTMINYRITCLNTLNMVDPPNSLNGYYYNVYIHTPGNTNDHFYPYGWGNGQGTDPNGNPFLTLPNGVLNDWVNNAHETFHIFQYNANAPGFAYSGNSQWYIEASANWFAAKQNMGASRAFVEAESLVRIPQVPLWLSYGNFPSYYPSNWQRYVHQYALALLLYYLTDVEGVSDNLITQGFFSNTSQYPQEYLYNQIGSQQFRDYFIHWTAHMVNDFDFIAPVQASTNETEWNNYADPLDDNEYIETYNNTGSGGWYQADDTVTTTAWSFNTYKLLNNTTATYLFELNANQTGSYGSPAYFQGSVLVKNSVTGDSIYDLNMANNWQGDLTLNLTPNDSEAFFIVASMPEVFGDTNPVFQLFRNEIRITDVTATGIEDGLSSNPKQEINRINTLGQQVTKNHEGIQMILYNDGTIKKVLPIVKY